MMISQEHVMRSVIKGENNIMFVRFRAAGHHDYCARCANEESRLVLEAHVYKKHTPRGIICHLI